MASIPSADMKFRADDAGTVPGPMPRFSGLRGEPHRFFRRPATELSGPTPQIPAIDARFHAASGLGMQIHGENQDGCEARKPGGRTCSLKAVRLKLIRKSQTQAIEPAWRQRSEAAVVVERIPFERPRRQPSRSKRDPATSLSLATAQVTRSTDSPTRQMNPHSLVPGLLMAALALSEAGEPVHPRPLTPEHNPWADKGIASNHGFGAFHTRKNVDEEWHLLSRTDEFADVVVRFARRFPRTGFLARQQLPALLEYRRKACSLR
jgi:hypothetical protein